MVPEAQEKEWGRGEYEAESGSARENNFPPLPNFQDVVCGWANMSKDFWKHGPILHFLTDQCQLHFNKVFGSSRPREVREPNQPSLDSRGAFASALSTAVPGASFHRFARGLEHGIPRPYRVHFSPTAGWIKRLQMLTSAWCIQPGPDSGRSEPILMNSGWIFGGTGLVGLVSYLRPTVGPQ